MSKIIITNDFISVFEELTSELGAANVRLFGAERFGLDEAKAAVNEAYIAENSLKTIVLHGEFYGIEAQNALLKILEEPPRNIDFVVVANSKSALLATIHSRLSCEIRRFKKERSELWTLEFATLDLKGVVEFVRKFEKKEEITKGQLLNLLKTIVEEALASGIFSFCESDYFYFAKLNKLCANNVRPTAILTPLLLLLLRRKNELF